MNSRDIDAIKSVMIEQRDEKMDRLERERNELLAALKDISRMTYAEGVKPEILLSRIDRRARTELDKAKGA